MSLVFVQATAICLFIVMLQSELCVMGVVPVVEVMLQPAWCVEGVMPVGCFSWQLSQGAGVGVMPVFMIMLQPAWCVVGALPVGC